jgi:hypothetical protein
MFYGVRMIYIYCQERTCVWNLHGIFFSGDSIFSRLNSFFVKRRGHNGRAPIPRTLIGSRHAYLAPPAAYTGKKALFSGYFMAFFCWAYRGCIWYNIWGVEWILNTQPWTLNFNSLDCVLRIWRITTWHMYLSSGKSGMFPYQCFDRHSTSPIWGWEFKDSGCQLRMSDLVHMRSTCTQQA